MTTKEINNAIKLTVVKTYPNSLQAISRIICPERINKTPAANKIKILKNKKNIIVLIAIDKWLE